MSATFWHLKFDTRYLVASDDVGCIVIVWHVCSSDFFCWSCLVLVVLMCACTTSTGCCRTFVIVSGICNLIQASCLLLGCFVILWFVSDVYDVYNSFVGCVLMLVIFLWYCFIGRVCFCICAYIFDMTGVLYFVAFVVSWMCVCLFVAWLFVFLRCGTNLLFRLFVCLFVSLYVFLNMLYESPRR